MTDEQAYLYVVGEVGEQTPVKVGVTAKAPRRRLAVYQGANWREVEYLLCRPIPIGQMLVDEFLVHRTLSPWWTKGEWYKVRDLADHLGGWEQLVDAAIAGDVPGGERFELASAARGHRLVGMKRVDGAFEISCTCGHTYLHDGRLPKAIEQFAATHLGISWQRPFYEPRRVDRRAERNARNRR